MRRLLVALILFMFGASFAGLNGNSAAAQGTPESVTVTLSDCRASEDLAWEEVCEPLFERDVDASIPVRVDPSGPDVGTMRPYAVAFTGENSAAPRIGPGSLVDEELVPEFMVVYVIDGTFAIDPDQGKQVVVSTWRESIPTLNPRDQLLDTPYVPTGDTLKIDGTGTDCTRACPVSSDAPVALYPGDIAIAEQGALCIYCLIGNGQIGDDQIGQFQPGHVKGLLEVYALLPTGADPTDPNDPNTFSWLQSWNRVHTGLSQQRNDDAMTGMMAWAFFNPGRCDH
jgi:hypothetical protein